MPEATFNTTAYNLPDWAKLIKEIIEATLASQHGEYLGPVVLRPVEDTPHGLIEPLSGRFVITWGESPYLTVLEETWIWVGCHDQKWTHGTEYHNTSREGPVAIASIVAAFALMYTATGHPVFLGDDLSAYIEASQHGSED